MRTYATSTIEVEWPPTTIKINNRNSDNILQNEPSQSRGGKINCALILNTQIDIDIHVLKNFFKPL